MSTKLNLIILAVFTLFTASLQAQNSEKDIPEKFFTIFENDPLKAIDYVFSTNKWMERNIDGIENLKNKYKDLLPLIGEYYGYEKITEKNVGENLVLISYLLKYDRQPIRFTFVLYRPDKTWQIQNFNFDDNIDDELEEAAKQDRN